MGERDLLRHSHATFTSEHTLLMASTAQRICVLADTAPDSTLSHVLPIVNATGWSAPPSSALPNQQDVSNPLPAAPVPPSPTIDLRPPSLNLQNFPLPRFTLYTDPDLARGVAMSMALVAADILSRLTSTGPYATDLTHRRGQQSGSPAPPQSAASRLVTYLQSAYLTGAPRLLLAWGPHTTTMKRRRHQPTASG